MGLAVNERDIERAQVAGDELVDRLLVGFHAALQQALASLDGRSEILAGELAKAGSELVRELHAVEGKMAVDVKDILNGVRLDITIPTITVKLRRDRE